MRFRKPALFLALAVVVGLVAIAPREASVVPDSERKSAPAALGSGEPLQVPERQGLGRSRGELFAAPPRSPVAAAGETAPPPPAAPPMPYRFAGMVLSGSEQEVLVSRGDIVLPVKVGDTLDGAYKVESIDGERIELVYLPLGTRHRIAVDSTLDVPNR